MGQRLSNSLAFWPQRINHFRCFSYNAPCMDLLTFIILTTLALTRFVVIRRNVLSRFSSRSVIHRTSLHCRIRCFIHDPGASGDTAGSLSSGEQRFIRLQVARPFLSLGIHNPHSLKNARQPSTCFLRVISLSLTKIRKN